MWETKKASSVKNLPQALLFLVKFEHSTFAEPYRIVNNVEPITDGGETFMPFSFAFIPNTQGEQSGASIVLSNVDREIASALKGATTNENIVCTVEIANVEKVAETFYINREPMGVYEVYAPTITKDAVSMNLNLRLSLEYNVGSLRYSPTNFPNIYA